MTNRAELLALAERVEGLTGPDREVDCEIVLALFPDAMIGEYCGYEDIVFHAEPLVHNKEVLPFFTSSLDAAMTLVPEGWWLAGISFCPTDFRSPQDREWHAEVAGPITWAVVDRDAGEEPQFNCEGGNAATSALALTSACLRALAEKEA